MKGSRLKVTAGALLISAVTACSAAGPAPSAVSAATPPAKPRWTSGAPRGALNNGGFLIYNNAWNRAEAGPQTIWVNSYHDWGVQSTQSGKSVKTFPSVQKNLKVVPLSSFSALSSTFAQVTPGTGDFEAAYDLLLGKPNGEVMYWVSNHGQTPGGKRVGTAVLAGQTWAVWRHYTAFTFVLDHNEKSGSVDLLSGLKYLMAKGWVSADAKVWQINFGWEICSTGGSPEDFAVTGYSLTAHWAGGDFVSR